MKPQFGLRLGLVVVLLVSVVGCGASSTPPSAPTALPPTAASGSEPTPGGKLVYGLTLVVSGIDPHIDASSELGIPLTSVYDTLVYQDVDGRFVPGLAERWTVSDDGLVYTFDLRRNVEFHDGTPFNAQAVQFNLDRIAAPETQSRKAKGLLGPYARTEVVDDYTVRVHQTEPYAPFLDSASQVYLGMASPTAVERWGAEYSLHQVGTGPFLFQEFVPQDHLTLVRNPDYAWAPEVYQHTGPAYLDEIEFRFYPEPATRALALESGEVHVVGEVPPQDAQRLQADPGFTLLEVPIPGQPLQFFLNTERAPTDDLRVRQAILHAVDRQTIVDTIFRSYSPVAHGPLAAVTRGYGPVVEGYYAFDPARAGALLDEVGWTDSDGDGVRDRDGEPFELNLVLMSWGSLPEVGQMLQAQLGAAGMAVDSQMLAFPAALEAAGRGEHHLAPMTLFNSDPSILNSTFLAANADGGFNWAKWRDPELDQLLLQAASELDPASRADLYRQAQAQIMEAALILPIRDYVQLNVARAEVHGLRFDPGGWFPWLYDVWLEP